VTSAAAYAELLIHLTRRDAATYLVESRFSRPGTDAYTEPDAGQATFDFPSLHALLDDPPSYGARLSEALFGDQSVLASFQQAVAVAASGQVPLRLRLSIDVDDAVLHALRWELLRDPTAGGPLAMSERILF
jgi:hypothetical protein